MNTVAERYARLSRCYIQLADQFSELDLEHMELKCKLVELIKAVQNNQQTIAELEHHNCELTQQAAAKEAQYQQLRQFELLLDPKIQAELSEAEKVILLIDETLYERSQDTDPALSAADKALLDQLLEATPTQNIAA